MLEHEHHWLDKRPLAYFIGLSAKPNCDHLDTGTRTGSIVEQIVYRLSSVQIVKTNLVRTPPLDSAGKLRYPNSDEMKSGWAELKNEIDQTHPNLLVTLGQRVSYFLRSQMDIKPIKPQLPHDFSHLSYLSQSTSDLLSIHHPSFVYVYRRKNADDYVESVVLSVSMLVLDGGQLPPMPSLSAR